MAPKVVPAASLAKAAPPPSQTLYVTNLNDQLRKDDLRRSLYILFSTYGTVLDVVALKTMKMRGQAHIVFKRVEASTQAMRALQGFDFFGKQMKIDYGRGKSHIISKLDGTAPVPTKIKQAQEPAATELQQSIFHNAPGVKPSADGDNATHGVKRAREDDDSEEEDAPMDVDDEGEEMDVSDDD